MENINCLDAFLCVGFKSKNGRAVCLTAVRTTRASQKRGITE